MTMTEEKNVRMVGIKYAEMPRNCLGCSTACDPENRRCNIDGHKFEETLSVVTYQRDKNCPLVEIITCKDCEYRREVDTPLGKRYIRDCNHATGCDDAKTFYCADARRRE